MSEVTNLEIYRGDDRTYLITVQYRGGNVDLTGCKLWFTVKASSDDTDANAKIKLTSATITEIEILNQTTNKGQARIYIPKASTDDLSGVYVFDIQYKSAAGKVQTPIAGNFEVKADVTLSTA